MLKVVFLLLWFFHFIKKEAREMLKNKAGGVVSLMVSKVRKYKKKGEF